MIIYTEFEDDMLFATTGTDGKRVVPGSVFRFCTFMGKPSTEIYQPGGMSGFVGVIQNEAHMRAFLVGLGFIEAKRKSDAGDAKLKDIAPIIAPTA